MGEREALKMRAWSRKASRFRDSLGELDLLLLACPENGIQIAIVGVLLHSAAEQRRVRGVWYTARWEDGKVRGRQRGRRKEGQTDRKSERERNVWVSERERERRARW